jgi:para-nitrobenzyl esterase
MKPYKTLSMSLLVVVAFCGAGAQAGGENDRHHRYKRGPIVQTSDGPVRGFVKEGVRTFLGIPYAAPPVGDLRWMPPEPPAPHGLLDATEFGNTCPQVTTLGAFAGPANTTEDCLFLNVYTTNLRGSKPVIVWIHGGGNVTGETNDYDGSKLATGGPNGTRTVVVTLNYRMGLFGFLSQDALNSEGHPWGNYGILDVQAALRWVQDNIAAFGGDPNNVTLGGQSAGASDTSANLISPLAAGLFHRAILQSSPTSSFLATTAGSAATALQRGNAFAEAAGCSDADCLRGLSAERILQLQGTPNANGPFVTGPFVDGTVIPLQPEVAWSTGQYHKMPIMGGATREESTFSESIRQYFSAGFAPLTAEEYEARVNATYVPPSYVDGAAAQVLAEYPPGSNPQETSERSFTDPGKCRTLHVLKLLAGSNGKRPVWGWDFTYQTAPYYFPRMPNPENPSGNFLAKASHTIDIQFLFPGWRGGNLGVNLDQFTGQPRELEGDEIALSDQLVAAWTNFAAKGDPNGSGAPHWPRFTRHSPKFLEQNVPNAIETEEEYRGFYNCDFWDPLIVYPTE